MTTPPLECEFPEPERYELREGRPYHFEISRREFAQTLGSGLLISVAIPSAFGQRADREQQRGTSKQRLHIGTDGLITVFTSKVEVGQGSRTQLSQAAAEELFLPMERIRLVMADSAVSPDDGGTAGSRTTPATVPAVRKACAAVRQLLIDTASSVYGANAAQLSVRNGAIFGLTPERQFGYVDLAGEKYGELLQQNIAKGAGIVGVTNWQVLGTEVPRVGAADIVTGAHRYPSDIVRPGMQYGVVLRPESLGAQLMEVDLETARGLAGVTAVRDGDFVGFAAPTSFAAEQARDQATKTATWKKVEAPSSDELENYLRAHVSPRSRPEKKGTPEEAFKQARKVVRETYRVAYIQHAPMEPRAAVAEWNDGQLTVWTGTQQPARVRDDLARSFRIGPEKVHLIVPDTGGGFGGKHTGEVAIEAARLAQAANKPVCVRWSREEEFTWAYFRPAGIIDIAGGLDDKGELVAWEHVNLNSGASAIGTPYRIPNVVTDFRSCEQPLRSGSYRALASTANTFARESVMDELSVAAGMDPLEFRLRHLANDRLRAVLVAAAERFTWQTSWRSNSTRQTRGLGLACGTEKGSYMACCVEIEVNATDGTFNLRRVVEAFECGAIQNPGNLRAQVEGCIIQGLGGALTEETRFANGRMLNPSFSKYRVPRFKDVPEIEVVLVNRKDLPSVGAGETPIIGVAPAIANALYHAVQVRIRTLPIRNEEFRAV